MIAHRSLNVNGRGSNMPNEVIDTAMRRHPDGFGIAWRDSDGLRWTKFGPAERDEFRTLLKAVDKRHDVEYVTHFRYATHGAPCQDLSHPYDYEDEVEGKVLVFHNGIIDIATTKEESDTQVFVRDILAKMPSAWWRDAALVRLVDMAVGWSKLVIMTATETVNLHEKAGTDAGGIWYSSNHKPDYVSTTGGYTRSGYRPYTSLDEDWNTGWVQLPSAAWVSRDSAAGRAEVQRQAKALGDVKDRALVPYDSGYGSITVSKPETTNPRGMVALWVHEGHDVQPLQTFDFKKDDDYPHSIFCEECGVEGDVYIIGGKAYIDMIHEGPLNRDDGEDDLLSPEEDARYRAMFDRAMLEDSADDSPLKLVSVNGVPV